MPDIASDLTILPRAECSRAKLAASQLNRLSVPLGVIGKSDCVVRHRRRAPNVTRGSSLTVGATEAARSGLRGLCSGQKIGLPIDVTAIETY